MRVLRRKEIMEIWSKQKESILDSFCCPSCRDILIYDNDLDVYYCCNRDCLIYSLTIDKDNCISSLRKEFLLGLKEVKHETLASEIDSILT